MKKKLSSFDSFSTVIPISPTSTDHHNQGNNPVFIREFETTLDEELSPVFEKKRRLSVHQVKELEKNFEVDNKLDPERKRNLAHEVGLHPRQVAVWFQNRRARWKTKQLERDYVVLKSNYDSLKHEMQKLHLENQSFLKEIQELKSKLNEGGERAKIQETKELVIGEKKMKPDATPGRFVGGCDDSDSSGIMNNDDNNTAVSCSFPLDDGEEEEEERACGHAEQDLWGEEDSCSGLFCVDQAPTLHWYHSTDEGWTRSGI